MKLILQGDRLGHLSRSSQALIFSESIPEHSTSIPLLSLLLETIDKPEKETATLEILKQYPKSRSRDPNSFRLEAH